MSHPVRVRGLKHHFVADLLEITRSHPVRVRGLKQTDPPVGAVVGESHPVRVRGLKPSGRSTRRTSRNVAPRAGAWVETR